MIKLISEIFADIGYLLLLVNCILLGNNISKKSKPYKVFFVYNLSMFIIQMTSKVLFTLKMNNLFLSHFYFIFQLLLLSYFYYVLIEVSFQRKIIRIALSTTLILLFINYAIDPKLFFTFNLFEVFISTLPLVVFAVFHLYNLLNKEHYFYYITIGLLIYLYGSTFLFLSYDLIMIVGDKQTGKYTWFFNIFLYVGYQLFILKDLLKQRKNGIRT